MTRQTLIYTIAETIHGAGDKGHTDSELEQVLGKPHQSVSARRRELEITGFIKRTGALRPSVNGRLSKVWVWAGTGIPSEEVLGAAVRASLQKRKPKKRGQGKKAPLDLVGMVRAACVAHGRPLPDAPSSGDAGSSLRAFFNMREDVSRLEDAVRAGNFNAAEAAACNIVYTALGFSLENGYRFGDKFQRLHRYYMGQASKSPTPEEQERRKSA